MVDTLILDADSIAYKAASANETRTITTRHIETDAVEHWDNRTAFRAYLSGTTNTENMYTVEDVQDPRHISYGKSLITEMIKGYNNKLGVRSNEIYIGGEGNFRDLIPLPMEHTVIHGRYAGSKIAGAYKGKREGTIRPVQLKELRAWMISELKAVVVNGQEVDDVGSIRAYDGWKAKDAGGRIIQVTCDKDALQCSGWLYNPDKQGPLKKIQGFGELHREGSGVKGTGRMWLYFQMLYGDKVDCYNGSDLWKIEGDKQGVSRTFGEVAAYNLLEKCSCDKEAWNVLHTQYKNWYPEPITYVDCFGVVQVKDSTALLQLYTDCAFMRRWSEDKIDCREVLVRYGII